MKINQKLVTIQRMTKPYLKKYFLEHFNYPTPIFRSSVIALKVNSFVRKVTMKTRNLAVIKNGKTGLERTVIV